MYPGSAIMLPGAAYVTAQNSTTATAMARTLLLTLFDFNNLLNSNLKGGASKRRNDDAVRYKKLDETKLEAIYCEFSFIFSSVS